MNMQGLRNFSYHYRELAKIEKMLHHLDENSCNYGLTPRQETRTANLEKKADKIVKYINKKWYAYHQGDPRGCSLYIVTKDQIETQQYSEGIPVYL